MDNENKSPRVLYTFPLRLGAGRICTTAWYQIDGLVAAGADITVFPAAISLSLRSQVRVHPTLAWGKVRVPNRILGTSSYVALHDWLVSQRLKRMAGQIDIIHAWPTGALRTLKTAAQLGIPTVLERCNAHTGFAVEVVDRECARLGVALPPKHEHAYDSQKLQLEEQEYKLAYRLLCPSDFVVKTFVEKGYPREKLVRHIYGFDEKVFYPRPQQRDPKRGLTMISVGVCAVRKGLHFALEAWLQSPASRDGTFLIAGEFLSAYREKLAPMLAHPSVKVLGHRNDVPELVRNSDILVLPSIEEGFGLVCTEAMASGCVPLVSEACTELCRHMDNSLVHKIADVKALTQHITMLHEDRALLAKLREAGLRFAPEVTWDAAGVMLLDCYRDVIASYKHEKSSPTRNRDAEFEKPGAHK
jgi:glycosyltransferase involved in cell wall biosynthesis